MGRIKLVVDVHEDNVERYTVTIMSWSGDINTWIPEDTYDDVGGTDDWADVLTTVDELNPDGLVP